MYFHINNLLMIVPFAVATVMTVLMINSDRTIKGPTLYLILLSAIWGITTRSFANEVWGIALLGLIAVAVLWRWLVAGHFKSLLEVSSNLGYGAVVAGVLVGVLIRGTLPMMISFILCWVLVVFIALNRLPRLEGSSRKE